MTLKGRVLHELSRMPMTAREVATRLHIDPHLASVLLNEMRESIKPCGHKREGRRGPESFVWAVNR